MPAESIYSKQQCTSKGQNEASHYVKKLLAFRSYWVTTITLVPYIGNQWNLLLHCWWDVTGSANLIVWWTRKCFYDGTMVLVNWHRKCLLKTVCDFLQEGSKPPTNAAIKKKILMNVINGIGVIPSFLLWILRVVCLYGKTVVQKSYFWAKWISIRGPPPCVVHKILNLKMNVCDLFLLWASQVILVSPYNTVYDIALLNILTFKYDLEILKCDDSITFTAVKDEWITMWSVVFL